MERHSQLKSWLVPKGAGQMKWAADALTKKFDLQLAANRDVWEGTTMEPIRLLGYVNDDGQIEIHRTEKLPPGDVIVLVEPVSPEVAADEDL